jgi:hypothetical protein
MPIQVALLVGFNRRFLKEEADQASLLGRAA